MIGPLGFFLIVNSLAFPPAPAPQNALRSGAPARFSLQKLTIFPGDVVRADVKVTKTVRDLSISFANQRIIFYPNKDQNRWSGLVGIDLETKPGRYSVIGTAAFADGQVIELEQSFQVQHKAFPVQRIQVEEKYVTLDPDTEKRVEEEAKKLQSIWKEVTPQKLWVGRFLAPVESQLTSGFGRRRIVNDQPRSPHAGVDLKAATGTPIRAANAGRVVLAENLFFSGNTVAVDHGNGLYTYYAHCSTMAVKPGDMVTGGQVIAQVGATGRVTGPHLHWASRLNEARVNPMELTRLWMMEEPQANQKPPNHQSK